MSRDPISSHPKTSQPSADKTARDRAEPAVKTLSAKTRRARLEAAYAKVEAQDARRARHSRYAPQFRAKLAIEGEK